MKFRKPINLCLIIFMFVAFARQSGARTVNMYSPSTSVMESPAPAVPDGVQKWVTILVRYADDSSTPHDPPYYQNMMGSAYPGMDSYWQEVSLGHVSIDGSAVVGWYNLPHPKSYYVYDTNGDGVIDLDMVRLGNDALDLADPDVYFPNFGYIQIIVNGGIGDLGLRCQWSSWYITADGKSSWFRFSWIGNGGSHLSIARRMGEIYGMPYSLDSNGSYDSSWDLMSAGVDFWECFEYGRCYPVHAIGYSKALMNWIPANRIYYPFNGSQTISLERMEQPTSANQYLLAKRSFDSYDGIFTIEARLRVGHDQSIPAEAVVIHKVSNNLPQTVSDGGDSNGSSGEWLPGEKYVDPPTGFMVEVLSQNETGFEINITSYNQWYCSTSIAGPTSASFLYSGGPGSVTVATTCAGWVAKANQPWIHITNDSGSAPGTLLFQVEPNPSSLPRTGTIQVGNYKFTVNQDQAPCTYTLSSSSVVASYFGGVNKVDVTSNCSWQAVSGQPWLKILSGVSGDIYGSVSFRVSPSPVERQATISIGDQVLIVTQSGPPTILFSDEFADHDASDWDLSAASSWNAAGGQLQATTNKKASAFAPSASECTACVFDFWITNGSSSSKISLYGWYLNGKNYVELLSSKGKLIMKQKSAGVIAGSKTVTFAFAPNVNYHIAVQYLDGKLSLFVDDALLMSLATTAAPYGGFGLRARSTNGSVIHVSVAAIATY